MSRSKTLEQLYIERIENGTRGIKMGTKKVSEVDLTSQFTKLKAVNIGMYDELKAKYDNVVKNVENKR